MSVGYPLEAAHRGSVLDEEGSGKKWTHLSPWVMKALRLQLSGPYMIGLYPEVQEKIHQELNCVLGADSKGPLSISDLNELQYLDCVLKESHRLFPPAIAIGRKISEDISICGHSIPKRTTVIVSPFLVHRDEDVFPDPEKFDPERFLPENSSHIPDCAYIPFAAGRETALVKDLN
ncbi:cytochrome P450 4V2 [Caerostris extrusa]|uniref:Cytochrome P450 4V2 n=1 Tax=Caerostris extrusa TaxID=172846 RepID=A0AAV4NZX4_CAEEX|nr:cytochrome P450 4V2 [Caerostris extrusa]